MLCGDGERIAVSSNVCQSASHMEKSFAWRGYFKSTRQTMSYPTSVDTYLSVY
jgi:hypothetical protein